MCEYHDYGSPLVGVPGDEFNGLQVRIDQCNALDKPIFVGEAGIKPGDAGGTLTSRADAFRAKIDAQRTAGVRGFVAWAWSPLDPPISLLDDYDIGPLDPALAVLRGSSGSPTNVVAEIHDTYVFLTWDPPASSGPAAIESYTVTVSPGDRSCSVAFAALLECDFYELTDGTAYTFSVTAHNAFGNGPPAEVIATPARYPDQVETVTATSGDSRATVEWSPPLFDGGAPIDTYTVTASPGGATCSPTRIVDL
jgi:hypothetical protein